MIDFDENIILAQMINKKDRNEYENMLMANLLQKMEELKKLNTLIYGEVLDNSVIISDVEHPQFINDERYRVIKREINIICLKWLNN